MSSAIRLVSASAEPATALPPFTVTGLAPELFAPLFAKSDDELRALGAVRVFAEEDRRFPCRVGLRRVRLGEELILLNHVHNPIPTSPYRASGPIFVARESRQARHADELPALLLDVPLSLRAYDGRAFIVDAGAAEGDGVVLMLARFLAREDVAWVDAHYAGRGCFAARIMRAPALDPAI